MAIPWPAVVFSAMVLAVVVTVLGILLYKNRLKRLRLTTTSTKNITRDVEAAKPESISTSPAKDNGVDALPKAKFVRPCHVTTTKVERISSLSTVSQASLTSNNRIHTPPTLTMSTPTELRPPVSLAERRPSATELIEAELISVGKPPKDVVGEMEEREKQKRKYKGLSN